MTLAIVVAILSAYLITGIVFLRHALRGPRRDDHPHCRRCDFDLSARAPDSPRCPECGSDLSRPRAIRPARRRKRPIPFAIGAVFILLPLAAAAALAIGTARGVYWNQYKPVWLLLFEHDDAALGQVLARARTSRLSPADLRRVTNAALAAQADRATKWRPMWGTLLCDLHRAKLLPAADWQRYITQAMDPPRLLTRPRVARDGTLPALVELTGRVGSFPPLYAGVRRVSLTLDDVPLDPYDDHDLTSYSILDNAPYVRHETYAPLATKVGSLPGGPHHLRMTVEYRVLDGTSQRFDIPPAVLERTTLESTVELLPAGADHIDLITDESFRRTVERSVTIGPHSPTPQFPAAIHITADGDRPNLYLEINNPPVGLAFTVTLRDVATGREFPFVESWIWGTGYAASANRHATPLISGSLDGFDADRADVILRPSQERAAKTPDLTRIWGHDITLKNVPVQWDKGARRPTELPDYLRPKPPATRRSRSATNHLTPPAARATSDHPSPASRP